MTVFLQPSKKLSTPRLCCRPKPRRNSKTVLLSGTTRSSLKNQRTASLPRSRYDRVKKLQEQAALFNLLNANGITTMQHSFEKVFDGLKSWKNDLKAAGEPITPKKWRSKIDTLTAKKDLQYQDMRAITKGCGEIEKDR